VREVLERVAARVAGRDELRAGGALRREPRSDVAMSVTSRVRSARIIAALALRRACG
jgi:hypothetical protein